MHMQGEVGAVNTNDYKDKRSFYRLSKMLSMWRRGPRCFDFPFYTSRSKDLPPLPNDALWRHFVYDGQFEGRPFRCAQPSGGNSPFCAIAASMTLAVWSYARLQDQQDCSSAWWRLQPAAWAHASTVATECISHTSS